MQARISLLVAIAVAIAGTAAAVHYADAGLTLSHYDARAHLVVARRILDSLTPGWQQIGAVWLPLPHVLNMIPVQIDWSYRTGASGVAISIASMSVAAWALASLILRTTGSTSGAITGAALLLLNPNVLYLQSTPMTEPLLFGTTMLSMSLTAAWIDRGAPGWPKAAGIAIVAACMTRYEAWPITAAIVALAGIVLLRRGMPWRDAAVRCVRLSAYPVIAVLVFMANSRWTVGAWFVSGGFFVPENVEALGHPMAALDQVREGLHKISGGALVWSGYAGAALVCVALVRDRGRASLVLVLSLAAAAALPWYAYLQGHPFRIRYDVPLVAACAGLAGAGIGLLWRPARLVLAAAVIALTTMQAHPLDRTAPMIVEAQRDAANMAGRRAVTAFLQQHYDDRTIMMSMGSLGHYMQDLSAAGFAIHDFLHEGNGEIWRFAMLNPAGMVGWVAIEERAEGGDALYEEAHHNARFLAGFERVAEGGGVALYRARR
ncbi:MAG TPA: hypothetical protein VF147_00395 [Vicinamibacterales bacterium]